jgi:hypothetical protein
MAVAASASGNVRSTMGRTSPSSINRRSRSRSAPFSLEISMTSRWETAGLMAVARNCRPIPSQRSPVSEPTMTRVPWRVSAWRRRPSERPRRYHDQVVWLGHRQGIGREVVHHVVGAQFSHQVDFIGATDAGDVSTSGAGDLDREAPHPARSAKDENPLPWLQAPGVEHGLECGQSRDWNRCGLREGEIRRFRHQLVAPGHAVFRKGSPANAKHLVTWPEPGDVAPNSNHDPGEVATRHRLLWPAQTQRQPGNPGLTSHHVPGTAIQPGGMDADE